MTVARRCERSGRHLLRISEASGTAITLAWLLRGR